MRSLRATQLALYDVISSRDGVDAALWDADAIEGILIGDRRLGVVGRVSVYADMYRLRLRAALASTYPFTTRVVGESAFAALADGYFAAHPSTGPSLRDGGAAFAGFLASRRLGWLVDLARLEWARHDVFDAVDEPILGWSSVRQVGAAWLHELPLRLLAAHRVVAVDHAIAPAWRRLALDADPGVPDRAAGRILVWRKGVSVFHRALVADEAAVIDAAADGILFGTVCEELADAEQAARLLGRWLDDGLLVP